MPPGMLILATSCCILSRGRLTYSKRKLFERIMRRRYSNLHFPA
jgi:hypothetical protein